MHGLPRWPPKSSLNPEFKVAGWYFSEILTCLLGNIVYSVCCSVLQCVLQCTVHLVYSTLQMTLKDWNSKWLKFEMIEILEFQYEMTGILQYVMADIRTSLLGNYILQHTLQHTL